MVCQDNKFSRGYRKGKISNRASVKVIFCVEDTCRFEGQTLKINVLLMYSPYLVLTQ